MMRRLRITYFVLIIATIIIGLLSRHFSFIPLFLGDILWAMMVYSIMCFLFFGKPMKFIIIVSLAFCYAIELSQLYKAPWITDIRHTLFGRLVLGEGFLWSDLLCYTVGVGIGIWVDKGLSNRLNSPDQASTLD